MIPWSLVFEALTPDPLEEAQNNRRMKVAGEIIRERRDRVHSALARSIPTEGRSNPAAHRVAS